MDLGQSLNKALRLMEMNQADLSRATGISRITIGNILLNRANPSIRLVERIAIALDMTLVEFLQLREETSWTEYWADGIDKDLNKI